MGRYPFGAPLIWSFMSEFNEGIFNIIKQSSFARALVYTIGHIIISMIIVYHMTGASLWTSGAVALVEPTINGLCYYLLDKLWSLSK